MRRVLGACGVRPALRGRLVQMNPRRLTGVGDCECVWKGWPVQGNSGSKGQKNRRKGGRSSSYQSKPARARGYTRAGSHALVRPRAQHVTPPKVDADADELIGMLEGEVSTQDESSRQDQPGDALLQEQERIGRQLPEDHEEGDADTLDDLDDGPASADGPDKEALLQLRAQQERDRPLTSGSYINATGHALGKRGTRATGDYSKGTVWFKSRYGARNVQQYDRSTYSTSNAGQQVSRLHSKYNAAIIIAVILVAIVGGALFWYIHTSPVQATVNGAEYSVPYGTTYRDLHDRGMLNESNGNYLAVDGSLIERGGGYEFKVYSKGDQVANNDARVRRDDVVTEARGDDLIEESDYEDETIPWTWSVTGAHDKGSLGIQITPGTEGVKRTLTGKVSGRRKTETETEMVPRSIHYYNVTPTNNQKVVALTFDDGPSATFTQQILDILTKHDAVATFFMVGEEVDKYPGIAKAVVDQGSQAASHTYSHPYFLNTISEKEVKKELSKAQESILRATGVTTTVVRPPGGEFDKDAWERVGDYMTVDVFWNIDTEDWRKPDKATLVQNATDSVKSGDVVLMHDGGGDRTNTVEALDDILSTLEKDGYSFVTVDELVAMERAALVERGVLKSDGTPGEHFSG